MEFWTGKFQEQLGNEFGKFLMVDSSFKTKVFRTVAKFFLEINVKERLVDTVGIPLGYRIHKQILDYKTFHLGV